MSPTPVDPIWIGVDMGTQSVRVVALDDHGTVLARSSAPLTSDRTGGRHTQNPEEWWLATCRCLIEITSRFGRQRIAAIAVSATSGTIVVVDENLHPLSPGLMYDDPGGAQWVDRINAVGAPVWSRLGYRMQPTWALPEILQLLDRDAIPVRATILHQPDLITSRLAGTLLASDSSHALKTGIDLDTLSWPSAVMSELGVDASILPAVVAPGTVIGMVDATGSGATGLPAGCPIVAGMTDGCAAQIGAGTLRSGDWNSVLGTTLVLKGVSTQRRHDPTGAVYSHRGPFGAGWFPGGASSTGAGAVSAWLPGADLDQYTADVAHRAATPVAYPLVGTGERFPFVAPHAHRFFDAGPDLPTGPELFDEIAHGVGYVERLSFDLMDFCGYDTVGTINFTGGGARNSWWNQLRCDLLDKSVTVVEHGDGAAGMAVLAAAAMDPRTDASSRLSRAAARLLTPGTELIPDLDRGHRLRIGYAQFLERLHSETWLPDDLFDHALGAL